MRFALSREIAADKTTTLEKARAIYDHVTGHMTYDKNHAGWGLGSTRHACDVGKGNCTDFHALFNSLCRAEGIASSFEIGLYLPRAIRSQGVATISLVDTPATALGSRSDATLCSNLASPANPSTTF